MTKIATVSSLPMLHEAKNVKTKEGRCISFFLRFSLEREKLLSKISRDPTVGSLRDKKENGSTWRGLRVGTRFMEFPQTPRGRGFSLLGFYSLFKYFTNV